MANKNFKVRHGLEVGDNFTITASTGDTAVGGNLTVTGNLTVNGTTTQVNTDVVNIEDNELTLNSNVTGSPTLDASLIVNRGTSADVSLKWNETTDAWQFTNDGSTFYNLPTSDANTTYTISAETATGGTNLRLTGSDATTDNVKFAEGTGITVTRTDADTITIATTVVDTNTTYSISAETATGGTNLRLTGSDASTDNVKLADGTGVTVTRTDADTVTIAIGQAVGSGDSPTFAAIGVDSVANIDTATLTTSTTSANQVLDSFTATTYRSAKYHIQMTSGSDYQVVEMYVVHDGTGASQSTYADIRTGTTDLATFSVDINSGNCRVLTTPTNAVTVYKIVRTAIVV